MVYCPRILEKPDKYRLVSTSVDGWCSQSSARFRVLEAVVIDPIHSQHQIPNQNPRMNPIFYENPEVFDVFLRVFFFYLETGCWLGELVSDVTATPSKVCVGLIINHRFSVMIPSLRFWGNPSLNTIL